VPVGCIEFGASDHVARIVLTAVKYDANLKSAMNIRYSSETIKACEDLEMTIAAFDRADEPAEVSTMEWGVEQAIESSIVKDKKVPIVIYDRGGLGKEAMVRVLGPLATDVADNVIRISSMVENEQPTEYFKATGQFP
jgi:hydroxymethylpyrimidine/phosphomethylpyrimidine kinase